MRLVDQNRVKEAENFNGFAAKALGVIAIAMIGFQFLF